MPSSAIYVSATYHIKSNRDVSVSDNGQGHSGLLKALIMTAVVDPEELIDLKEMLFKLSQHVHYQVLFAYSQRGHAGPLYLHATHQYALEQSHPVL